MRQQQQQPLKPCVYFTTFLLHSFEVRDSMKVIELLSTLYLKAFKNILNNLWKVNGLEILWDIEAAFGEFSWKFIASLDRNFQTSFF